MSRHPTSLSPAYFDRLYAADPDPWQFATSDYEREKYAATLAALPRERYASILEVGCSVGVLTRQLAARGDALQALDVSPMALDQARERCAALPHVRFAEARVPTNWPAGTFDLVVLSEVVYYLDRGDVDALALRVAGSVAVQADIILVHWLGETDYPLTDDEAAERFIAAAAPFARVERRSRAEGYRLDVLRVGLSEEPER